MPDLEEYLAEAATAYKSEPDAVIPTEAEWAERVAAMKRYVNSFLSDTLMLMLDIKYQFDSLTNKPYAYFTYHGETYYIDMKTEGQAQLRVRALKMYFGKETHFAFCLRNMDVLVSAGVYS